MNGNPLLVMEVDIGAVVTIIPKTVYKAMFAFVPLVAFSLRTVALHTFTSQSIDVTGQITVLISHKGYEGTYFLVVVGLTLLGRDWLSKIQLDWDI